MKNFKLSKEEENIDSINLQNHHLNDDEDDGGEEEEEKEDGTE